MANQIVFVELPDTLNGDPYQLSSVPSKGTVYTVGTINLSGDDVDDPTLDPQILVATSIVVTLEAQVKALKTIAPDLSSMDAVLQKAKDNKSDLEAQKAQGYQMIRTQWYESIGTSVVSYSDSESKEVQITLGTTEETSHSTSSTVGMEFGTSTTDANSADMNVGIEFEGVIAGGSTSTSHSTTTSQSVSQALQITESSTSVKTKTETTTVTYTADGGDNGARYVIWQIIDRIQLIRNSDNVTISDVQVQSCTQMSKYEFDSPH